jgi:hypothetical protein
MQKKDSKLHFHSIFLNCDDFQSYPNVRDETMETYKNIFTKFHAEKKLWIALALKVF